VNRSEVVKIIGPLRCGAPMLVAPGLAGYPIAEYSDEPMTIYNVDMPYATATALGVALGWPEQRVIAIEGDGSFLMGGVVSLSTIARYRPKNLVLIVFDNGVYLTTGSGRATTPTSIGTDIEQLARAAGITNTTTVSDVATARKVLKHAFSEPGPWLVVAKIDISDREATRNAAPLPTDIFESGQRFRAAALKLRAKPKKTSARRKR
jgi:TPP-dependent trihydroxycyclohexane-1,2-dione (THcHDO) dehydratase